VAGEKQILWYCPFNITILEMLTNYSEGEQNKKEEKGKYLFSFSPH
jgi:hypothetical protein